MHLILFAQEAKNRRNSPPDRGQTLEGTIGATFIVIDYGRIRYFVLKGSEGHKGDNNKRSQCKNASSNTYTFIRFKIVEQICKIDNSTSD